MEFETLFNEHRQLVYRVAYSILRDYDDANDIVVEVFQELYINMKKHKNLENIRAWLITVTRTRSDTFLKKFRRLKTGAVYEWIPDGKPVDSACELHIFCDQILQDLYTHNPKWFDALVRHCLLGMTYEEIAAATGVSTAVIKTRVYRGREYLKSKYGDSWRDYITTCVLTLFMVIQYILLYNHYKIHGGIV